VRSPRRALVLDGRGEKLQEAHIAEDAVLFEVGRGDWLQLGVEFT
jgi:hypothetical protein